MAFLFNCTLKTVDQAGIWLFRVRGFQNLYNTLLWLEAHRYEKSLFTYNLLERVDQECSMRPFRDQDDDDFWWLFVDNF